MWCEMRLGQFLVGLKPQALGFIRRYDECIVKRENKSSKVDNNSSLTKLRKNEQY